MSTTKTVVSREEWTKARKELLAKERAFTHERDALSAARRALPAVKVDEPYVFQAAGGERTLAQLFDGKRQLVVYHFMFDPAWEQGCKSCSMIADGFDDAVVHLAARDTSLVAVSRAPLAKLEAFQRRMGWRFPWVSSANTDFNHDYHTTFLADEAGEYNYAPRSGTTAREMPGMSVFLRQGDDVLHAYSTYARGLDALMMPYTYLDLTPLGRQEDGLPFSMDWVRLHDSYGRE